MTDNATSVSKPEFETVIMYRCIWCGSLFKTDHRHRCKFSPKICNCFSCAHCKGVDQAADLSSEDEGKDVILICGIRKLSECAVPVRKIAEKHWKMGCPSWQQMNDYQGKDSYMNHTVRHI